MSAKVVISNASTKRIIYHRQDCMYADRIKTWNRVYIPVSKAEAEAVYCQCKYCGGLAGDVRSSKRQINKWSRKLGMEFSYVRNTARLYIRTKNGFWKIIQSQNNSLYLLFHLNHYVETAETETMMKWHFHRQVDVAPTRSLAKIVNYISEHDKAKEIMQGDYRNLPRDTKKQRRYYAQARRREYRKSCRRMDSLFDQIEAEMKQKEAVNAGVFIGQAL